MIPITGPLETMSIREVNRHRAQIGVLLCEPDVPLTELVDLLCMLTDRGRDLDPDDDHVRHGQSRRRNETMPNQNEIYEEAIKEWRASSEKKEAQYTARSTEYIRHEIPDAGAT